MLRSIRSYSFVARRTIHTTPYIFNAKLTERFLYLNDYQSLEATVNEIIIHQSKKVPEELTLSALKACKILEDKIIDGDKSDEATAKVESLVESILSSPNLNLNEQFLKSYLLTRPNSKNVLKSLQIFHKRNPNSHIPKEIAMIPFRFTIYNGDINTAFKIINSTTAHPSYIKHRKSKLLQYTSYFFVSTAAFFGSLEAIIKSGIFGEVASNNGFYAMLLAYIGNTSLLASIAFSSKLTRGGTHLQWDQGVLQNYWFYHADELKMCSRILETDAILNGNGGFATPQVITNISQRKMFPLENEKELMFQEYWASGGDGFEWVEPDQDPADLIWQEKIARKETFLPPDFKLQWTDKLINASSNAVGSPEAEKKSA